MRPRLKTSHIYRDLRLLVWPRRRLFAIGLVLIFINRAAGLVLPGSTKYLIDDVVLNRREGRRRYGTAEVERALGMPVLAAVPEDRRAARRAVEAQLPMTTVGGRVARELRRLAATLMVEPAAVGAPAPQRRWRLPFSARKAAARS